MIEQAFANQRISLTVFFFRSVLGLLLDIREMLIVQNLIGNQMTGLIAQASGTPVEKRAGGVIIP